MLTCFSVVWEIFSSQDIEAAVLPEMYGKFRQFTQNASRQRRPSVIDFPGCPRSVPSRVQLVGKALAFVTGTRVAHFKRHAIVTEHYFRLSCFATGMTGDTETRRVEDEDALLASAVN